MAHNPRTTRAPHASRYVPLQYAADRYGISIPTVRRYIADGLLTAYRVGPQALRLDADEVDRLAQPIPTSADWS